VLAILAVVAYAGINVGQIYFRYYAFQDQMKQSARFAETLTDSALLARLGVTADSLGLPYQAHRNLRVQRNARTISLATEYSELLDLHVWSKALHFRPIVVASF
jgi:hypothetical protein